MRKMSGVVLKILALLLAVVLGFSMCIGSIVLAGYVVYAKISYDTLGDLGIVPSDTSSVIDPEAEVCLTGMTIQGLLKEIEELTELGETVTINMLTERYGLKLTDEQMRMIPEGLRTVALSELFAEDGLDVLFESIELNYILQFIPKEVLAEPARIQLRNKTVKDVIAADLGYLLDGVCMGHILGVTYGKDASGNYVAVYADPENPTLVELIAPIDLGNLLSVFAEGGDLLAVFHRHIGDVMLSQLLATMVADEGPMKNILEGKTVADIIKQGEDGIYVLDVYSLLDGQYMGAVLGLTPIYADEVQTVMLMAASLDEDASEERVIVGWRDANGTEVYGITRGLAFATLEGMQDGFNVDDMLTEVYFGDLLEYRPVYDYETGEILSWTKKDGSPIDPMYESMAPKKLQEALGGENNEGGFAMGSLFEGVFLGDVLGYTADYDALTDGIQSTRPEVAEGEDVPEPAAWYAVTTDEGGVESEKKVTGLDATLANIPLGKLMDSESGYEVSDAFEDSYVGDLMSYGKGDDGVWYEYVGGEETAPEFDPANPTDNDYVAVTGIDKAIANISIGKMLNDPDYEIEDEFDGLCIGELLDYQKGSDGEWYEYTATDEDGNALEAPSFDPANPTANGYTLVTGVNARFADYDLGKVMKGEEEITADDMDIAEVLALTSKDYTAYYIGEGVKTAMTNPDGTPVTVTVWFDKNDVEVDPVIAAIATMKVGDINAALGGTRIGQVIGYYAVERETGKDLDADGIPDTETAWYSGELEYAEVEGVMTETGTILLTDAEGIMLAMADLTVNDMSDNEKVTGKIQTIEIGEAMGYVKNDEGEWCEYEKDESGAYVLDEDGNRKLVPLTGVMKKIAGKKIGELDNSVIDDMYIYEVMGYEYDEATDTYKTADGAEVTGIMAAIAGYTVGGLDDEGGLDTLLIGKVIGWKWVANEETVEDTTDGYWYDPKTESAATGIMTHFADLTVNDLSDNEKMTEAIKDVSIAEAMGYTQNEDGVWCDESGASVSGLMSAIANMKVGELDDENGGINGIYVGDAMDYYLGTDGEWYEYTATDEDGNALEAPSFDPANPTANGYTPAKGMMSAFAGLTIGELKNSDKVTEAIQKVQVGEAMGYTQGEDGVWYEKDENGNLIAVTGVMKVIADSHIATLDEDLDKTLIGDILGYTRIRVCPTCDLTANLECTDCIYVTNTQKDIKCADCETVDDPDCTACTYVEIKTKTTLCEAHASTEACEHEECAFWWYDLSQTELANQKTTPLVNKMSSSTIGTIGTDMDALTVGDIFTEEDLNEEGSFLTLIAPETKVSELGHAVNETFETTKMSTYVELGILTMDEGAKTKLDELDKTLSAGDSEYKPWRECTINEFINHLIGNI